MKKLKVFFTGLLLLFAVQISVANGGPLIPNAQLRAELVALIGTNFNLDFNKNACTAEVLFTVNNAGEVIVLTVYSSNPYLEKFIKSKINYKKVNFRVNKVGEIYLLPIRVANPN